MLPTTFDALKSILRADPSIAAPNRTRLLALLRQTPAAPGPEATPAPKPRLIRRGEAAQLLSRSLRTVDKLSASGVLPRRTLPGRARGAGFLESDVLALIHGQPPTANSTTTTNERH